MENYGLYLNKYILNYYFMTNLLKVSKSINEDTKIKKLSLQVAQVSLEQIW